MQTGQANDPGVGQAVLAAVTTTFSLGWQMARLYEGPMSSNTEPNPADDLPGLSALQGASLVALGLAQCDSALARLAFFLGNGTALPSTAAVREQVSKTPTDRDEIRTAILALHVELLVALAAADFRLGKAYGLGRALADTCASAGGDQAARNAALQHHLEPHRALVLVGWLDDLKTVLPAHTAAAVTDSFQRWITWAEATGLDTLDQTEISGTTRMLHRSGQRWRAILSAEKDPKDLLTISDYRSAARGLFSRLGALVTSYAWQLKTPLAAAAVLIGVGIALMFLNHSTGQVLAGLGTVGGGLGITWRSATRTLGHLSLRLGEPLWGAELDAVIGNRLTPPPQRDFVTALERPHGRLHRAWRELRTADADAPRGLLPPIKSGAAPAGQEAEEATSNAGTAKTEPLLGLSDDEPLRAT